VVVHAVVAEVVEDVAVAVARHLVSICH
jgi:hypothetical protein